MLARQGILDDRDAEAIEKGLLAIFSEIENGEFRFSDALEDIHMNVEARLEEIIGRPAGRLHTARSRNDQVATDFRMWVREETRRVVRDLSDLIGALVDQAERGADFVMPGFTHLQTAQPVTWGHHMMAYVEMFARDIGRFRDAGARMNESPLGSAALAGTSFPLDRESTSQALGFDRPMENSIDAVSARDFAAEYLSAAAICAANLSRLAEEIVLWTSSRFSFASLGDRFTTGSSIMPQKRNPDAAELVRAKTGRINGSLVALLTVMKALPLAYSKDLQEDKEQVFDAADTLGISLAAMTGMIKDLEPIRKTCSRPPRRGFRRQPTFPTGWCAWPGFRFAKPITQPGSWSGWPRNGIAVLPTFRLRTCVRCANTSPKRPPPCSTCGTRRKAEPAMAARPRCGCASRSTAGKRN